MGFRYWMPASVDQNVDRRSPRRRAARRPRRAPALRRVTSKARASAFIEADLAARDFSAALSELALWSRPLRTILAPAAARPRAIARPKPLGRAGDKRSLSAEVEQAGTVICLRWGPLHSASSIRIGVWSEGLSRPRISLSIVDRCSRSAACGDSSRWSMRMPLFRCQAPA